MCRGDGGSPSRAGQSGPRWRVLENTDGVVAQIGPGQISSSPPSSIVFRPRGAPCGVVYGLVDSALVLPDEYRTNSLCGGSQIKIQCFSDLWLHKKGRRGQMSHVDDRPYLLGVGLDSTLRNEEHEELSRSYPEGNYASIYKEHGKELGNGGWPKMGMDNFDLLHSAKSHHHLPSIVHRYASFLLRVPFSKAYGILPWALCSCSEFASIPSISFSTGGILFSNRTDQEALLSFKSLIINDPSNTLSSWNDSSSVCQWPGVFCNHHGGVSALDLGGLGLTGSISPHIGNLSTLRFLCLQDNHFTGTLPDQLGNLLHLQVLNVSSNFIGGAIPSNMSKSSNLITLDLSANNISGGIPAELGLLSKIQVLKLGSNQLTEGIPSSMGNLSSLTTLDLGTNMLSGSIPTELGRLRNLKQLQISVNNLTGTVPPSLYNVSSLETFALAANNLYGEIPSDVGLRLPTLKVFHCCFNEFTGPYPPTLHNITKLQSIRLSHNFFAGSVPPGLSTLHDLTMYNIGFNRIVSSGSNGLDFITSLTNSTKLRYLAIDENLLEGVLPESVGNLSNTLSKFYMGGNRIYGSIPASIAQLTNLTLLNMSHNSIFGEIPLEIGQLKQLQMLGLARNSFSGEIPAALGNLTMLTELELYGNKLEGSIPAIFSQFQRLLTLDLSNNNLKGSIPRELFALTSLSSLLNLSRNSLTGPLPEDIGRLENLAALDLSNNFLSGYISNSIGNCRSLETLSMSNNSFSGLIPNTLGNLKGLQSLDLSSNQLSGSIPESLGKLRVLQYLNLSFNDLEGEVPKDGIFRNLSNVHLEGNARLCTSYLCPRSSHRSISVVLLVIIVASVVSALCFLCLLYFVRREINTKVLPTADSIKGQHRMVSYEELHHATEDFDTVLYDLVKRVRV
ncbi:uncharacterized protein [Elaeis guineensis]|uniref:uncharacterized protein n=1 Tax=Elaeis guineensis var. tenera TaxID=51953 RepID=UPI003C6D782F